MDDPEIKAITDVTNALSDLSEEQRRNVLLYVNARYGGARPASAGAYFAPPHAEAGPLAHAEFDSIGEFFDAADPKTEAERVLTVGYWKQVIEGAQDFESYPVNQQLKNLGHPVSNITRALDVMMSQSPRFVIQTSKTGTSKQARKKYKITREGIKRVQGMLDEANGGDDAR
jgi:hypothetical protein